MQEGELQFEGLYPTPPTPHKKRMFEDRLKGNSGYAWMTLVVLVTLGAIISVAVHSVIPLVLYAILGGLVALVIYKRKKKANKDETPEKNELADKYLTENTQL